MTSRNEPRSPRDLGVWRLSLPASACVVALAISAGCKKKPPPPPPPPPPVRVDTWGAVQDRLDTHVDWPRERRPSSVALAESIAELSNAIARGDAQALRSLLTPADQAVLQQLVDDGQWKASTDAIRAVRINLIDESTEKGAARVVLAIEDDRGAYLMGWRGMPAGGGSGEGGSGGGGGGWVFSGMETPDTTARHATELDPPSQ